MEKIILGLLMLKGMSIYEMKTNISSKLNAMCSSSAGSIHTAIKQLMGKGFIKFNEVGNKKIYFITEKGRQEFTAWIIQPISREKAKNIEASKVFFMGMVQKEESEKLIKEYIDSLKQEQGQLSDIYQACTANEDFLLAQNKDVIEQDEWNTEGLKKNLGNRSMEQMIRDIYDYQMEILRYAIDSLQFEIDWYQKMLVRRTED